MNQAQHTLANGRSIVVIQGDITRVEVDAIVNAANPALAGGGGVDGAIHTRGGPEIMRDLDRVRPQSGRLNPGEAVATTAGHLPARFVFHTAGPVYRDGAHGEPEHLAACYRTCLDMAVGRQLRTLSFPAISTGIFGYPKTHAAEIAIREVLSRLSADPGTLETVYFVQFSPEDYTVYRERLPA